MSQAGWSPRVKRVLVALPAQVLLLPSCGGEDVEQRARELRERAQAAHLPEPCVSYLESGDASACENVPGV